MRDYYKTLEYIFLYSKIIFNFFITLTILGPNRNRRKRSTNKSLTEYLREKLLNEKKKLKFES